MKTQKKLGAAVLSLGLVVGLSGFAGATTGTIDTTGAYSDNTIHSDTSHYVEVDNNNNLKVHNDNDQDAWTGDAEVEYNTNAGSAVSGDAMNDNAFDAEVVVDNSGAGVAAVEAAGAAPASHEQHAAISNTGYSSDNHVTFEATTAVEVENNNNLYVHNDSNQTASSGDAEVNYNTNAGDATSGSVSNTNSTSVRFEVTN